MDHKGKISAEILKKFLEAILEAEKELNTNPDGEQLKSKAENIFVQNPPSFYQDAVDNYFRRFDRYI